MCMCMGWGLKVRGWGKNEANTITVSLTKNGFLNIIKAVSF